VFKNGRSAAIFFLLLCPSIARLQSIELNQNLAINQGLLDEGFWKSQPLSSRTSRVVAYTDVGIRMDSPFFNQAIMIERRVMSTLSSNTNTLALAAREGAYLSQLENGTVPLQASTKRYEFEALGLHLKGGGDGSSTRWYLTPKWVRMINVREARGAGWLEKTDTSVALHGVVSRQGMTPFGYEANMGSTHFFNGGTLDAGVQWNAHGFNMSIQGQNFYSRIPVDSLFFSERSYQINSTSEGIAFSNTPSLKGTYGRNDNVISLPRVIKSEIAYFSRSHRIVPKWGIIKIDRQALPWVAVAFPWGSQELELKSYEMNNTQVTYRMMRVLDQHLSIELSALRTASGSSQAFLVGVKWDF
jgi:hypothetical protein